MLFKNKLLILILFAFIWTVYIKSQPVVGFQGGINAAWLDGHKEYDENKPRVGISLYAFTDIPLGRNSILSLETGAAISMQGMNHTKTTEILAAREILEVKNRLDYIVMPIYLKENFDNFYTKIGPYAAYCVNARSKYKLIKQQSYVTISEESDYDEEFKENVKPYDIGVSFGFGYVHFFDPKYKRYRSRGKNRKTPIITIDFRYNLGLTSIDATGDNSLLNLRNRTFTLGLTITSIRH